MLAIIESTHKKICLCFVVTFYFVATNAQELTLQNAINLALKNSFDIQIAKNNVTISNINNHIGIAGGLPTVTATASDQENIVNINQKLNTGTEISRNGATSNFLNLNVTGTMLLYNGYRVIATKKRLQEIENQSQQLLNAQIQNTIATVMVRYFEIVRQQRFVKTLELSIALSNKQLELVKVKQNLGLANNTDLFQTEIGLNTRLQDLENQRLIIAQAKTDLLNTLLLKPDSLISINDTILVAENVDLASVINGIQQNPEIISLNQQIKINELIEKETAALSLPSVRANTGLNYGRNQANGGQLLLNQSYGPFISLGVTLPIYTGTANKKQQQIATINTKNAQLQKDNVLQNFLANATRTFKAYSSNLQQVKTQQNTCLIADQLVTLVQQRYQLAQATTLEIIEALRSYEEASFRLTNLTFNAKIAEIELKRLSGKLGF